MECEIECSCPKSLFVMGQIVPPENDMLKIMPPVLQNVTLFRKRVIDDVISEDEVTLGWDGP